MFGGFWMPGANLLMADKHNSLKKRKPRLHWSWKFDYLAVDYVIISLCFLDTQLLFGRHPVVSGLP